MLRAIPSEASSPIFATPSPSRHARAASFDLHLLSNRPAPQTSPPLSPVITPSLSRAPSPNLSENASTLSLAPDAIFTEEPRPASAQQQAAPATRFSAQDTMPAYPHNAPYAPPPVLSAPFPQQPFPMMGHPFAPMPPVVPALVDIRPILQERAHLQQQLHHKDAELLHQDITNKSAEAQSQRYIEKLHEDVFLSKQRSQRNRTTLNTLNDRYTQELTGLITANQQKDRIIENLETEKKNIAQQVEASKAERDQLNTQNEALQSRITTLEENLVKQEQEATQQGQKNAAALAETKQAFAHSSASMKATMASLESKQANLEKAIAAKEDQLTALEHKNTALHKDLETAKTLSQTKVNTAQSLIQQKDRALDLNTKELRQVKSEKASLQQQVKELQTRSAKTKDLTKQEAPQTANTAYLRQSLENQEATISTLSKDLENAKLEKTDAQSQATKATERATDLETENARLQRQLAEMTEQFRSMEEQRDSYRDAGKTRAKQLEKVTAERNELLEHAKPSSTLKPALVGASFTFAAAALTRLLNR